MAKRSKKRKVADGGASSKVADEVLVQRLPGWLSRDWLWALILLLAVILAYSPVGWAGYIWDDDTVVTANPVIVGPLGLKEIWTTSAADICPLTLTTFWLEHALWGLAPLPYHLVNVLMHGACAVLLWRVLRSLTIPGAWLGAALWALHPVEVESVAWIAEMKNTESCLFYLLSILFFMKGLQERDHRAQSAWSWNDALTLLFAAMAMASKSSTVILPVVLCLCAWWAEGRWQWRNLARIAPIFLMSIAAGALSVWTQGMHLANDTDPHWLRTWPERLATAGDAVWFYLGKLLWPFPLSTIYPRWQIATTEWFSYLPLLLVLITVLIFWLKRESWSRPWFFVFAYFLVALLPVLGLVDHFIFRYSMVFDHFQYLAGMGPLALAGAGMARWAPLSPPGRRGLQAALCAVVLLILGTMSWQRTWAYEGPEALWSDTLVHNPNCWLAYNNLGEALFQKREVDKAIAQYQSALEIIPNYPAAHNNLGQALFQKGDVDKAMDEYQKALEIDPNYAPAHNNLGAALLRKGQTDEAIAQYQKALEIRPNYAEPHNNLGGILLQKGHVDEAMAQYQKAFEIDPNYAEAHTNLGLALFQKGQVDEAIAQYQNALEIDPNSINAHYNLGVALAQRGQRDDAIVQYQKVLKINPNRTDAHNNLGSAFLRDGRVDEAIVQFQQLLEIDPNDAEAHNNLGVALTQKGDVPEAIAQFQEALRLKADFSKARSNLAKVQAMARPGAAQK